VQTNNSFLRQLFVTLLGLLLAQCAAAQTFGAQPADAPNLVLLEVRLDDHLLAESITAYQFGNDIFLPLGELSKLLTIAIRTEPSKGAPAATCSTSSAASAST
jgi:hypothetical protein